uniref:Uncharacterized protein n=1 Tax=Monopterus albus TaxID=43700 RepID=A0A3Q3JKA5_MONAL
MPRQFLQDPRSPFLGSFTMCPFFQSAGTLPSLQTFCSRGSSMLAVQYRVLDVIQSSASQPWSWNPSKGNMFPCTMKFLLCHPQ